MQARHGAKSLSLSLSLVFRLAPTVPEVVPCARERGQPAKRALAQGKPINSFNCADESSVRAAELESPNSRSALSLTRANYREFLGRQKY